MERRSIRWNASGSNAPTTAAAPVDAAPPENTTMRTRTLSRLLSAALGLSTAWLAPATEQSRDKKLPTVRLTTLSELAQVLES
jgi:hypothetical protein